MEINHIYFILGRKIIHSQTVNSFKTPPDHILDVFCSDAALEDQRDKALSFLELKKDDLPAVTDSGVYQFENGQLVHAPDDYIENDADGDEFFLFIKVNDGSPSGEWFVGTNCRIPHESLSTAANASYYNTSPNLITHNPDGTAAGDADAIAEGFPDNAEEPEFGVLLFLSKSDVDDAHGSLADFGG